jgi:hypothetical protein
MRTPTLFLLATLAAGAVQASSLPTEVVENLDDYRIVLYLSETQINAIPAWQPGEGAPPMSLDAAVSRTLAWIGENELLKNAQIHELKFKPVHNFESLNRWYYLVELHTDNARRRFLAVLPGGEVVPAVEEPGR